MFASISRRLAILNVAVVALVIALVGGGTYLLLRESLIREANAALEQRIEAAAEAWEPRLATAAPLEDRDGEDDDDEDNDDDEEEHESREILESGDILLFIFDGSGRLIGNERGVDLDRIPVTAAVERALDGDDDTRVVTVDGETIRVRTEPIEAHGEVVGVIQATRSERQHNEELRLVGLASLTGVGLGTVIALPAGLYLARRAMRPIDAAFQRQRAFVADASHELRTPLTVLRANAELVQRLPDPSADDVRAEMDEMLREIDRMTAIVNDLLLLARSGEGAAEAVVEPVAVGAPLERAVRALRPHAEAADITLVTDLAPDARALANAALVEQIARILLDNAVTYTTPGDTVEIAARQRDGAVEICVRDHGPGIAPEDQPYVFDRFYRADRARARHTGGTGLGLAIARSLVQALNGEIRLESAPGEGTVVCFTLPRPPH